MRLSCRSRGWGALDGGCWRHGRWVLGGLAAIAVLSLIWGVGTEPWFLCGGERASERARAPRASAIGLR